MYVCYDPDIIINDNVEPIEIPLSAFEDKSSDTVKVNDGQVQCKFDSSLLEHFVNVACDKVQDSLEGDRHHTLIKQARLLGGYVAGSGLDENVAKRKLMDAWKANASISSARWKEGEEAIKDGIDLGKKDPINLSNESLEFSERQMANFIMGSEEQDARLFVMLNGDKMRFSRGSKNTFYRYENGLWKVENEISKDLILNDFLRPAYLNFKEYFMEKLEEFGIDEDAIDEIDENSKKQRSELKSRENGKRILFLLDCVVGCSKKLGRLQTQKYHLAIIYFLKRITEIDKSLLDRKPKLFHFNDGVFDFEEDRFREHRLEDYLTKSCGHNFPREDAQCPKFKKFIELCFSENGFSDEDNKEITNNDITYMMAQSMIGSFTNQCWLFTGEGHNGKSTFIDVIGKALGGYYYSANGDKSLSKSREQNIILADCQGVRLFNVGDLDDGFVIDNNFKTFVSDGEQDKVRKLYGEYFGYDKQFVVVGFNNDKLKIASDNASITHRFVFMPWLHHFPMAGRQVNEQYFNDYIKEIEGILRMMLNCSREWYQKILNKNTHCWSKAVKDFNECEYERQTVKNSVRLFFEDEDCKYALRSDAKITRDSVYSSYCEWCSENGIENKVSKNNFKKYLPAGIKSGTSWNSTAKCNDGFYFGLGLKAASRLIELKDTSDSKVADQEEDDLRVLFKDFIN